jgi:hypothetical protein
MPLHPIETTVIDTVNVVKDPFREELKQNPREFGSVATFRTYDLPNTPNALIAGRLYSYDASDVTTTDDGLNCVHDAASRRYKLKTTVVSGAAAIAFTDGDTARRVTIANSLVSATSRILATVRRPDTADDSADRGYLYTVAIVRQFAGGFDAFVMARDFGGDDCSQLPPNETITLNYMVI